MLGLLIGLLSGAAGGNIAGALMKSAMGPVGRSIVGILGGGGLSAVLGALNVAGIPNPMEMGGGMPDMTTILALIGSGGAGGGILTAILGMLKK